MVYTSALASQCRYRPILVVPPPSTAHPDATKDRIGPAEQLLRFCEVHMFQDLTDTTAADLLANEAYLRLTLGRSLYRLLAVSRASR